MPQVSCQSACPRWHKKYYDTAVLVYPFRLRGFGNGNHTSPGRGRTVAVERVHGLTDSGAAANVALAMAPDPPAAVSVMRGEVCVLVAGAIKNYAGIPHERHYTRQRTRQRRTDVCT